MTELLVALPIAIPLATAAACLVAWRSVRMQRVLAIGGLAALLAISAYLLLAVVRGGPITLAMGGWPAPIGIVFRADLLGVVMTLVSAIIGVAVTFHAVVDVPEEQQRRGFWPLLVLLVMGACGAFLTGDLFNLFVWFEVLLIASFVLLCLAGTHAQLAGAHVYVVLSLIGSALFLIAVGVLYGAVKTLDLAQISERMTELSATEPSTVLAIQALLLVSFGLKAAVFPLMFWLPASYHTPAPSVSALFAALLTKVGVYAMLRITLGVFPRDEQVHDALVIVAIATMIVGVMGALAQESLRRILSFHIVSQIGYMVAGLAVADGSPAARRFAIAATIFYVVHHILVKANLFLIAGIVRHVRGTESLGRLGGVARAHPWLAGLFLLSALSLAGVPPLSGFWAKLSIIAAALERDRVELAIVAAAVGLLTLTSMMKIWIGAFAGTAEEAPATPRARHDISLLYAGSVVLAALTLMISIAPDVLFQIALGAADQIAAPSRAITSLGGAP